MKYRVIGANRQTGARMTLEFEAESKAAAERKATQAGMSVNHVADITDGYTASTSEPIARRRPGGGGGLRFLIVLLVLLAALWWLWHAGYIHVRLR